MPVLGNQNESENLLKEQNLGAKFIRVEPKPYIISHYYIASRLR